MLQTSPYLSCSVAPFGAARALPRRLEDAPRLLAGDQPVDGALWDITEAERLASEIQGVVERSDRLRDVCALLAGWGGRVQLVAGRVMPTCFVGESGERQRNTV